MGQLWFGPLYFINVQEFIHVCFTASVIHRVCVYAECRAGM